MFAYTRQTLPSAFPGLQGDSLLAQCIDADRCTNAVAIVLTCIKLPHALGKLPAMVLLLADSKRNYPNHTGFTEQK